ncbi:MAG: ubiquinol-cytochrome c reductase iron-sulfur subunit [Proteobacteria bacterium]|nr:ubiquinol-cytochrome c reductase iron-sulfur subunit [Pseudomonadota bacterium]
MTKNINKNRRNLLLGTGIVGVIGAGFSAVPFLKSWLPSEKAKAFGGPVQVNISKVESGQMLSVLWRGQPVFLVNRTKKQTDVLKSLTERLKDPNDKSSIQPDYIDSIYRVRKDNFFVVIGICTHLGCVPKYHPELVSQPFDREWKGGFYCPCHNSRFDISGRVYKGSPAGRNLDIPPYTYLDDNTIEIGNDGEGTQ